MSEIEEFHVSIERADVSIGGILAPLQVFRRRAELKDLFERRVERARDPERISSDGEYFPASIAFTVCRVTPACTANSCWVISPWWNRSVLI